MNALFTVIAVLVLIAAILLTIVVLLQNGKGGGLASNFVAGNQTFGVRQTADLLEKVTWGLVIFILLVSIISTFTLNNNSASGVGVSVEDELNKIEQPAFPTAPIENADPSATTSEE